MKAHQASTCAALLLTLAVSAAWAQTGQSGSAGAATNGATQTNPPAFNPNSNPNPNPTSNPVGNPPSPVGAPPTDAAGNPIPPAGQTSANSPAGPPATNPAGTAPVNPAGTTTLTPTIGMNQSGTSKPTQLFQSLDPARKGYLSAADVASNKFLATNFSRCDTNGDGRLTQAETTLCMQSAPPGQQ